MDVEIILTLEPEKNFDTDFNEDLKILEYETFKYTGKKISNRYFRWTVRRKFEKKYERIIILSKKRAKNRQKYKRIFTTHTTTCKSNYNGSRTI